EHIADTALADGNENARARIEQRAPVHGYAARLRPQEAGDHIHDRGLASARGTEKRGNAGLDDREIRVEREVAQARSNGDLDAHVRSRVQREARSARTK